RPYHARSLEGLRSQGYCGRFQFWEVAFPEADKPFGFRFPANALNSAAQQFIISYIRSEGWHGNWLSLSRERIIPV
ncbi:MAG: hypothetical protein ABIU20_02460, partial [Blastocatellia bacterium]